MSTYARERKQIDDFLLTMHGQDASPLLRRAEEAMNGMLVLNGTGPEPVFVGIPPKWEENPCGIGGYTWTMSRLTYMVTLSKAFLITGSRKYLHKVEVDLNNWFDEVPPPPVPHDKESANYYHCIHNWRMLELGFRMVYTFPILLAVLRVYGEDRALIGRIEYSIAQHAERISAGSILLWPGQDHNHYTEEINGLLSAASLLSEDSRTPNWIQTAMDGLEHACACQITEDGAQIESSHLYHIAVVINFCYSIHFAAMCGKAFSPAFVSRVKKGLDFAVHITSPDGNGLPYGDSESKLYTAYNAAMLSYLIFGETRHIATLRQLADSNFFIQQLYDQFPWGFDRIADLLSILNQPLTGEETLLPTTVYQRQMNQFIVRSGWNRDAAFLYFACDSPMNPGSNHAHMDQLGIIFGAYGKVLLQDPGRYTYKDCEDRHLFKSSQLHNVPTVNGEDAFQYLETFKYGPQEKGELTAVMDSPRIQGAYGYHDNYSPVRICRSTALVDHSILLIADTYHNIRSKTMKVFFHLNSTNVLVGGNTVETSDQGANIRIHTNLSSTQMTATLLEGRISDVFYHDYPSKRAVFSRTAQQDTETLIFAAIPFSAENPNVLQNLQFDGQIISFHYNGSPYTIRYEDGIFFI